MRVLYQQKRIAFDAFLNYHTNSNLRDFAFGVFNNVVFDGTNIPKADFILELLQDDIGLDYWIFLRSRFRNLGYLTDSRHCEEYAFDIVLGWLSEELIKRKLEAYATDNLPPNQRAEIGFMGIDAQREFQDMNIRAKADIFIDIDPRSREEIQAQYETDTGKKATRNDVETLRFRKWYEQNIKTKIDIFADYLGTWQQNGYFDLKKGKINHFEKNQLDWVLALDITERLVYLVSRDQALEHELTWNPSMRQNTAKVPLTIPFRSLGDVFQQLL